MGMKNAIRKPALPDIDDLEGWQMRVVQLEGELKRAQMMVDYFERKQQEQDEVPFEAEDEPEGSDDAA